MHWELLLTLWWWALNLRRPLTLNLGLVLAHLHGTLIVLEWLLGRAKGGLAAGRQLGMWARELLLDSLGVYLGVVPHAWDLLHRRLGRVQHP